MVSQKVTLVARRSHNRVAYCPLFAMCLSVSREGRKYSPPASDIENTYIEYGENNKPTSLE
jgi:hypothetical protein